MSTCDCKKQDGYANCCKVKALEEKLNIAIKALDDIADNKNSMNFYEYIWPTIQSVLAQIRPQRGDK